GWRRRAPASVVVEPRPSRAPYLRRRRSAALRPPSAPTAAAPPRETTGRCSARPVDGRMRADLPKRTFRRGPRASGPLGPGPRASVQQRRQTTAVLVADVVVFAEHGEAQQHRAAREAVREPAVDLHRAE